MAMDIEGIFQVSSWMVATLGGLIAAFRAIYEMRLNREERARSLKWMKAREAKKIVDDMNGDFYINSALQMLDWERREISDNDGRAFAISHDEVLHAMRIEDLVFDEKEVFIRECFDRLYDAFEKIESFLKIELIEFFYIECRMKYYLAKMSMNKLVFFTYMKTYNYSEALHFCDRFSCWSDSKG